MTPYYADDLVTIYHGDALELLPQMDRAGIVHDHTVTDPPYGAGAYASDKAVSGLLLALRSYTLGTIAVFGYPELLIGWCVLDQMIPDEWITWWPSNAAMKSWTGRGRVPREAECIAIFGDTNVVHGAPQTAGGKRLVEQWGNRRRPSNKARGAKMVSELGKRWGDVWTDAAPGIGFQSHRRLHPNEKPVSVMARLVSMLPLGSVLDPFMGSGTTLVAAKAHGRCAVGIEIDERYCETAANRCRQEVLGLDAA